MGLKGLGKRLRTTTRELDDQRLLQRFTGTTLDLVPIATLEPRRQARVGGEIKRVLLAPRAGSPTLEVMIGDGTGSCTAVFNGRSTITGMFHGRSVVFEGVPYEEAGRRIILNPIYTLLPH